MSENQAPPYSLRMPQALRDALEEKAKDSKRSLNAEIVAILEDSLTHQSDGMPDSLAKVILLNKNTKRVIYGKLLNFLDLDYTQDLESLKSDIELTFCALKESKLALKFAFMRKNIRIYEGGHHLDIIDDGVGSLRWLTVEDHFIG